MTQKDNFHEAKMLRSAGLDIEVIRQLRETVELVGKRRKIPPAEALRDFRKDVDMNYDTLLGLKQTLKDLESTKQSSEKELREMNMRKVNLDKYCVARQKQIDAYESLAQKGIDDKTLLLWDETLSESGLNKTTVATELRNYSSLKRATEKLQEEIDSIEDRKGILSSEIKALESNKKQLVESLQTITKEGVSSLESHLDTFRSSMDKIENQTLSSVTSTSSEVRENVRGLEDSVTETVTKVRGELDSMGGRVDALMAKAVQVGIKTQRLTQYAPLLEFYDRGAGSKATVLNISLGLVANLKTWANANDLPSIKTDAERLETSLRNESIH